MPKGKHVLGMPKGKHIFGTARVGDKGQIVIPKEARSLFGISPGDTLLILGDEENGILVTKTDVMNEVAVRLLNRIGGETDEKDGKQDHAEERL